MKITYFTANPFVRDAILHSWTVTAIDTAGSIMEPDSVAVRVWVTDEEGSPRMLEIQPSCFQQLSEAVSFAGTLNDLDNTLTKKLI